MHSPSDSLPLLSRRELEARVGSVRDAFGPRTCVFEAGPLRGQRGVDLTTGASAATILPDRACDLYALRWEGVSLGFYGSPGAGDAALYRGRARDWLESFSGFMATCGLRNVGPPAGDLGMHGQIAHARADELAIESGWDREGFVSTVKSRHREAAVFGPNLELRREWRCVLGRDEWRLRDEITNLGFETEPLLLLYHVNIGFPLLDASARLLVDAKPQARDEDAAGGLSDWDAMTVPVPGFREQVFFFAGAESAAVVNENVGCRLTISWNRDALPFLTEWKHMGSGDYALGIEPGNCHPLGRDRVLDAGQGRLLAPGESFVSELVFALERL
jgi:hypothetical protein